MALAIKLDSLLRDPPHCSEYLNNIIEQDHRMIKRKLRVMQGFRAFHSAWKTIQGIETVHIIHKGQIRWLPKDDVAGQVAFIGRLLGRSSTR